MRPKFHSRVRSVRSKNMETEMGRSWITEILRNLLFSLLILSIPSLACSAAQPATDEQAPPQLTRQYNQDSDLTMLISEMAARLFRNLADNDPQTGDLADGLIVCTFVDINKLSRTSSFGRYLAGQLMTEFQQRKFSVIDIQKNLSVIVQPRRGEYGLSRNSDEIADEISAGAMLTGTYLEGRDNIIVNARILDNKTAALLSSATLLFPKNELTGKLLADSASARTKPEEFVYLKKLDY